MTDGPTTWSPPSVPKALQRYRAWAGTRATTALRQAYGHLVPARPQRHLVVNTLVTEWDGREASATSDFVFLFRGEHAWTVRAVGRYHDVLHRYAEVWRFHSRVVELSA